MRNSLSFSEVPLAFARRCLDSGFHFALKRVRIIEQKTIQGLLLYGRVKMAVAEVTTGIKHVSNCGHHARIASFVKSKCESTSEDR